MAAWPHARTLRTSLGEKFLDALKVFDGIENKTAGVSDYLTLFIPFVFNKLTLWLFDKIKSSTNPTIKEVAKPLFYPVAIVNKLFLLARMTVSIALTALASPFIMISQGVVRLGTSKGKEDALAVTGRNGQSYLTLKDFLDKKDPEKLTATIEHKTEHNTQSSFLVTLQSKNDKKQTTGMFQVQINDLTTVRYCPKIYALFSHNYGGVGTMIEKEQFKELKDALIPTVTSKH